MISISRLEEADGKSRRRDVINRFCLRKLIARLMIITCVFE